MHLLYGSLIIIFLFLLGITLGIIQFRNAYRKLILIKRFLRALQQGGKINRKFYQHKRPSGVYCLKVKANKPFVFLLGVRVLLNEIDYLDVFENDFLASAPENDFFDPDYFDPKLSKSWSDRWPNPDFLKEISEKISDNLGKLNSIPTTPTTEIAKNIYLNLKKGEKLHFLVAERSCSLDSEEFSSEIKISKKPVGNFKRKRWPFLNWLIPENIIIKNPKFLKK